MGFPRDGLIRVRHVSGSGTNLTSNKHPLESMPRLRLVTRIRWREQIMVAAKTHVNEAGTHSDGAAMPCSMVSARTDVSPATESQTYIWERGPLRSYDLTIFQSTPLCTINISLTWFLYIFTTLLQPTPHGLSCASCAITHRYNTNAVIHAMSFELGVRSIKKRTSGVLRMLLQCKASAPSI